MRVDDFDFDLPDDLIALRPLAGRDTSRLLVVEGQADPAVRDAGFRDLPSELRAGDLLVFNDTKVLPVALSGQRVRGDSSVAVHANLIRRIDAARWQAFARPGRRLAIGDTITFAASIADGAAEPLSATVETKAGDGTIVLAFDRSAADLDAAVASVGAMPLPPYIANRRPADAADHTQYQTVYARADGAVAAPTAGLHFTEEMFARLEAARIARAWLTLHVGAGTFLPVKTDTVADHDMHAEFGEIGADAVAAIAETKARGGRVIAVGTTSLRLLEAAAAAAGTLRPFAGETDIFITPGFKFRVADMLITNFHLPRSTLFMLVSAFAGYDLMRRAYAHAIAARYRFYSYGDSSLLALDPDARAP
ncbi:MAG: tRNA preQ1(34) S-adenosylmethionine ribosyltransferase-isomerase QueA [Pseudomonadota bacterium]